MKISGGLTADKATKWIDTLEIFLEKGCVVHKAIGSLIGKIGFSQTCIFGEFARYQLRAIYLKLRRRRFTPAISERDTIVSPGGFQAYRQFAPGSTGAFYLLHGRRDKITSYGSGHF